MPRGLYTASTVAMSKSSRAAAEWSTGDGLWSMRRSSLDNVISAATSLKELSDCMYSNKTMVAKTLMRSLNKTQ